jgi:hypothetical protein
MTPVFCSVAALPKEPVSVTCSVVLNRDTLGNAQNIHNVVYT